MESTWTLKEAATHLGVSRETIRRAVAGGELPSAWGMEAGRRGHRVAPEKARAWWVAQYGTLVPEIARSEERVEHEEREERPGASRGACGADFEERVKREDREERPGASRGARGAVFEERVEREDVEEIEAVLLDEDGEEHEERVEHSHRSSAPPRSGDLARALEVASASLRQVDAMQRVLHEEREDRKELVERVLRVERERLAAEERGERERRRADHLAAELQSYQRVLAEQAESLVEERARRMAAELAAAPVEERVVLPASLEELSTLSLNSERQGWGCRLRRWFFGSAQG